MHATDCVGHRIKGSMRSEGGWESGGSYSWPLGLWTRMEICFKFIGLYTRLKADKLSCASVGSRGGVKWGEGAWGDGMVQSLGVVVCNIWFGSGGDGASEVRMRGWRSLRDEYGRRVHVSVCAARRRSCT
ncbi:hypothetical protein Tco_0269685 [Tanacetum coccineum]